MLSAVGPAGADPDRCSAVTNLCEASIPVEPAMTPDIEFPSREPDLAVGGYLDAEFRVLRNPERHDLDQPPYGFFYAKVGETVWLVNSDTRQIARRAL